MMKSTQWCMTTTLALGLAACPASDRPEAEDVHAAVEKVERTADKVGDRVEGEAEQAEQALQDRKEDLDEGVAAARETLVRQSRKRLQALERELGEIETKADAKQEELTAKLRKERERLAERLDELEAGSERAWTDGKDAFADGLAALEEQIAKARQKIEPDA